jgi:acetate CoA/acetoacetate CoA-transferase alpha subunit
MGRTISVEEAAQLIPDGASVMLCGPPPGIAPPRLVQALVTRRVRNLTVIARDLASPDAGVGRLIEAGCVARAIVARAGGNAVARRRMMRGEFALELLGPERFVERIRATGRGLGGVLLPPGRWSVTDQQLLIELDGLSHVVERPLRAQFALLAASRADAYLNLAYARGTPDVASLMASAAECVIVEPETVEKDALSPSVLQTSGIAVTYLVRPVR